MPGFAEAVGNAARAGLCQLLSANERAMGILARVTTPGFPLIGSGYEVSRALRRNVCGEPALPPQPPPSTGGQCTCIQYQMQVTGTLNGNPYSNTYIADGLKPMFGPMRFLGVQTIPGTDSEGVAARYNNCNGLTPTSQSTGYFGSFGKGQLKGVSGTFTPRWSGGANNCGDEPTIIPPATPTNTRYFNPSFTWNTNAGITIEEGAIQIQYGFAYINDNSQLIIPVQVSVGGDNYYGNINQDGDFNFTFAPNLNIGGGDGAGRDNPDDATCDPDGVEREPIPPLNPIPEDREEQAIIGCVVTCTSIGNSIKATSIAQSSNPTIYAPKLGHINFLVQVGAISSAWTSDIYIKNNRQIVTCPWPKGAIAVRGTPEQGVAWRIQPIYNFISMVRFP